MGSRISCLIHSCKVLCFDKETVAIIPRRFCSKAIVLLSFFAWMRRGKANKDLMGSLIEKCIRSLLSLVRNFSVSPHDKSLSFRVGATRPTGRTRRGWVTAEYSRRAYLERNSTRLSWRETLGMASSSRMSNVVLQLYSSSWRIQESSQLPSMSMHLIERSVSRAGSVDEVLRYANREAHASFETFSVCDLSFGVRKMHKTKH